MLNTPDIACSECGEAVSVTVARIVEETGFDTSLDDVRYLCPVCVIQSRNAVMQNQLLKQSRSPV